MLGRPGWGNGAEGAGKRGRAGGWVGVGGAFSVPAVTTRQGSLGKGKLAGLAPAPSKGPSAVRQLSQGTLTAREGGLLPPLLSAQGAVHSCGT